MLRAGGLLHAIKDCSGEERQQHSRGHAGDSCRNAFQGGVGETEILLCCEIT